MAELDDSVGQVRAALAAAGVADNTLVIFSSDNGPWNAMPDRMFGRDIVKPWDHGTPGPFRGGKAGTYEGGHRVPFVAVWPGDDSGRRASPMRRSASWTCFPTLAGRAGLAAKVPANVDGLDVWPVLSGADAERRPSGCCSTTTSARPRRSASARGSCGSAHAVMVGGRSPSGAGRRPTERVELFHLLDDPSERYDQSAAHPDVVARLRARLDAENARRVDADAGRAGCLARR